MKGRRERGRGGLLRRLASVRLTLLGLALLGAGGVIASRQPDGSHWLVVAALALLSLNLVAALASNPVLRVRPALFGMHIGLLVLALSLAFGQLSRYRGHFEISEGEPFDPARMITDRIGIVAPSLPAGGAFVQADLSVNYAPGLMRRETQSRVRLARGGETVATDGRPLVIDGYRFYVTHNKGFAALVTWWPETGAPGQTGTLHFPSYPRLAPVQTLDWTAPDGTALTFEVTPRLHPEDEPWTLTRERAETSLRVRSAGSEVSLQAGDSWQSPQGGRLRFEGIRLWIGYRVFYDPSLAWSFASAVIAVGCLSLHLLGGHPRRAKRVDALPAGREVVS